MKAIFEMKVYELRPKVEIDSYNYMKRRYEQHTFDYNGLELNVKIPLIKRYVDSQKIFKETKEFVIYDDLYRLDKGDKFLLKPIDEIVTITDKIIINDSEVRFGISKIVYNKCNNYEELEIEMLNEIENCKADEIKNAERLEIERFENEKIIATPDVAKGLIHNSVSKFIKYCRGGL